MDLSRHCNLPLRCPHTNGFATSLSLTSLGPLPQGANTSTSGAAVLVEVARHCATPSRVASLALLPTLTMLPLRHSQDSSATLDAVDVLHARMPTLPPPMLTMQPPLPFHDSWPLVNLAHSSGPWFDFAAAASLQGYSPRALKPPPAKGRFRATQRPFRGPDAAIR